MSIASEKELITEPFSFTLRQNSAIEDDSHLSAVLDQTNLKSKFEEPTIIVEGAMKIMGRVKAVTDLKNIVEIPSCLRPEESCYHADTIAKRSVPNDRQTACLQNHLNSGSSTVLPTAKPRRRSKIPQYGVKHPTRMTDSKSKRDSSVPNLHELESVGRRRLFAPQNSKNGTQSHKITPEPIVYQQQTETISQHSSAITMMMQRPIRHDFPLYDQPSSQSISKPTSQSIQIKRTRGGYDDSAAPENSAERMYDWATWRMYHRITTARKSRASVLPYGTTNHRMSATATSSLKNNTNHMMNLPEDDSMASGNTTPSLASLGDYELEGEVFDIEM